MFYRNPGPHPQQAAVARNNSPLTGRNFKHVQADMGEPPADGCLGREGGKGGGWIDNRHTSCKYISVGITLTEASTQLKEQMLILIQFRTI